MENRNTLFSVEQAIDASKWDKKSTWAGYIDKISQEKRAYINLLRRTAKSNLADANA